MQVCAYVYNLPSLCSIASYSNSSHLHVQAHTHTSRLICTTTDEIIVGTPIKADGTLFGGVQGPPAPWVINGLIVSVHSRAHFSEAAAKAT
jgi:hypothetical protein